MKARSLLVLALVGCGEASAPGTASIVGRIDAQTLGWVDRVDAHGGGRIRTSPLDDRRAFDLTVASGATYRLELVDALSQRREFVVFPDGGDQITVNEDPIDVGSIVMRDDQAGSEGPTDDDDAGEDAGEDDAGEDTCESHGGDCRFETYNLEVQVGDRFVITNFLGGCDGEVGVDFVFDYEDRETWNLDAFNSNAVVEITEADLDGGNHGDGEYRVFLFDGGGEELDHMTIRIGHDDESMIEPGDDVPPAASGTGGMCPSDPNDDDNGGNNPPPCTANEDCAGGSLCIDGFCGGV